jgi:hypothetical protein
MLKDLYWNCTRRAALCQRLENLATGQRQHAAVLRDFEHSQALALAEEEPPAMEQWHAVKQQLAEYAEHIGLVQSGLEALDLEIDTESAFARYPKSLAHLRLPHLEAMVQALQTMMPHNAALNAIESKSLVLLGFGQYHLYNGSLPGWLRQLERSLALLKRGAGEGADDAA